MTVPGSTAAAEPDADGAAVHVDSARPLPVAGPRCTPSPSCASLHSESAASLGSFEILAPNELEATYLRHCGEAAVRPIGSFQRLLRSRSSLEGICLDHNYFGARGLTAILRTLRHCAAPSLSLAHCMLTHEHLGQLRRLLSGHPTVARLDLRGNQLGPQGSRAVLDLVASTRGITEVLMDPTTPKKESILQRCQANQGVHVVLTQCVSCNKCMLGPGMEDVEEALLRQLAEAVAGRHGGDTEGLANPVRIAAGWRKVRDSLALNSGVLALCDCDCLDVWLHNEVLAPADAPTPDGQRRCAYSGRVIRPGEELSDGCRLLTQLLPGELDKLRPARIGASAFARLVGVLADAGPFPKLAGRWAARGLLRAGLTGGGGLLPPTPDPRDWLLRDGFGALDLPPDGENFSVCDAPHILDQGDMDVSAAAAVAGSCEFSGEVYDPLYTFAAARSVDGVLDAGGQGCTLRAACLASLRMGLLPGEHAPFRLSDPRRRWASWHEWQGRPDAAATAKAAASQRKGAFYSLDPPPQGYDLFDGIRAALWAFRSARRPVVAGCKWRPSWTASRGGVLPRGHAKGGLPHGCRVLGQKFVHAEPLLAVAPSLGHGVGDGGVFYMSRETVNREFRYGVYMFRDSANARPDLDKIMGTCSEETRALMALGQEVDDAIAFLSTPRLRQGPLSSSRGAILSVMRQMPLEAVWAYRGASRLTSQRDDERLVALRRLYRGGFTAQIAFFWEIETTPAVRAWLLQFTAALRAAAEPMLQRRATFMGGPSGDSPRRRRSEARLSVARQSMSTVFRLTRRPSTVTAGAGQAPASPAEPSEAPPPRPERRKSSVLHLKNPDRRAVLTQEARAAEAAQREQEEWQRTQQSLEEERQAEARLAEQALMRSRALRSALRAATQQRRPVLTPNRGNDGGATGGGAFPGADIFGDDTAAAGGAAALAAAAGRATAARALLSLPGEGEVSEGPEAIVFAGPCAAVVDIEAKRLVSPLRPLRGHPLLPGFPLPAGVDAVVWSCLGRESNCYLFAQGVWVEFDAAKRRATHGPHLIRVHPLFCKLPAEFHTGIDCAVCLRGTGTCYFMRGRTCIDWDVRSGRPRGDPTQVGKSGPFSALPAPLAHAGVDACINQDGDKVLLLSRQWGVIWDLSAQEPVGEEFLLSDADKCALACLPAHTTGHPTALMADIAQQLAAHLPPDAASRPVLWPQAHVALGAQGEVGPRGGSEVCTPALPSYDALGILNTCLLEFSPTLQLLTPEATTLLAPKHSYSAWGSLQSVGVVSVEKSGPATITFVFENTERFGYIQVCGHISSDAALHVEASPDGISWAHVAAMQQWVCVADAWWAEQHACRYWRVAAEGLREGDVIHRVHWHTVVWSQRHVRFRVLDSYLPSSPVAVTGLAPVLRHHHSLIPNVPSATGAALVAWPGMTERGWHSKHCVLPLLTPEGRPSDAALFAAGTMCLSWSFSERCPLDRAAVPLSEHPLLRGLPAPFVDVGIDAAVYASPRTECSLVYLFCDGCYLLWDLKRALAVSLLTEMRSDTKSNRFRGLPHPFCDGVDAACNLFRGDANDVAFFRDGHVVYWSMDTGQVTQGPIKVGGPVSGERDAFAGLTLAQAANKMFAVCRLPRGGDGFVVFTGSEWLRIADTVVAEGPHAVTAHRQFLQLQVTLGWHSLQPVGSLTCDLGSSTCMFLGLRLLSVAGRDSRATFQVQWSDDRTEWTTAGKHNYFDGWGKITWDVSAVNGVGHRFWRLLLLAKDVKGSDAAFCNLEWLVLPGKHLECVPAALTTDGTICGATEALFDADGGDTAPVGGGVRPSVRFESLAAFPSITVDLGQPVYLMKVRLFFAEGWSGEWCVASSDDGVLWETVASLVVTDGDGSACWSPFTARQHWQLAAVDADCPTAPIEVLGIKMEQYAGPLGDVHGDTGLSSAALLLLESAPGGQQLQLVPGGLDGGGEAMVTYDFQNEPQAFTRIAFTTQFARGQRTKWLVHSSIDGSEWALRSHILQSAPTAEATWDVREASRYWRLSCPDGSAALEALQWLAPHTSLGTSSGGHQLTPRSSTLPDGPAQNVLAALLREGNEERVLAFNSTYAPPQTPVEPPPESQDDTPEPPPPPSHWVEFSAPPGACCAFVGVAVRTAQNPEARWAVQAADARPAENWVTIAEHRQCAADWCRTTWAYAGRRARWRLLLLTQTTKCNGCWYLQVRWQAAAHSCIAPAIPPHRQCATPPNTAAADGVRGPHNELWQWRSPTTRRVVTLPDGAWVSAHFPRGGAFVKLRALTGPARSSPGSGRAELTVQHSADGQQWKPVDAPPLQLPKDRSTASVRWPWCGCWDHWRVVARGVCAVEHLLLEAEVPARGLPQLDETADWAPPLVASLPPVEEQITVEGVEGGLQVQQALVQEARGVAKKIVKLSKGKGPAGFELHACAREGFPESSLGSVTDIIGPLHLKDFKPTRPGEPFTPAEAPRLDFRATLLSPARGLLCSLSLSIRWLLIRSEKLAPPRAMQRHNSRAHIVMEASETAEDWLPTATFPNCPGLLYDCRPSVEKRLAVVCGSPTTFGPATPLVAPSGAYAFAVSETLTLDTGVSIVTELASDTCGVDATTNPLRTLLYALMPDGAATAVFHTPTFKSEVMTLNFTTGSLPMGSLPGAKTGPVTIAVRGGREGITGVSLGTTLDWELQGRVLSFYVTGDAAEDGSVRLRGPLKGSCSWSQPHGLRGAELEDVSLDITVAASSDGAAVVAKAGVSGTLVIGGGLSMRCRADVRGAESRLTAHGLLLTAADVLLVARALAPDGEAPEASRMRWLPDDLRLEDAVLRIVQSRAGRRTELRGRLRVLGEAGDCRVECRPGAALLRAALPRAVVGPLHLSPGAGASAINAEVMLTAEGHVLLTARVTVAGLRGVPACVRIDSSGARLSVGGFLGDHPALHAAMELRHCAGSASSPSDFAVSGALDKIPVEDELRGLLLQTAIVQYIAAAGLRFSLRLDSVTLEPFRLSRPTLCAKFVGVLMGADFDMLAAVDPGAADDCLPSVASKLVEQCWMSLQPLYHEFAAHPADGPISPTSAHLDDAGQRAVLHEELQAQRQVTVPRGIDW